MTFLSGYRTRRWDLSTAPNLPPKEGDIGLPLETVCPHKGTHNRSKVYLNRQNERPQRNESCEDKADIRRPPFQQNSSLRSPPIADQPLAVQPFLRGTQLRPEIPKVLLAPPLNPRERPLESLGLENELDPIEDPG